MSLALDNGQRTRINKVARALAHMLPANASDAQIESKAQQLAAQFTSISQDRKLSRAQKVKQAPHLFGRGYFKGNKFVLVAKGKRGAGFGARLEKGDLGEGLSPGYNAKLHKAAARAFGLTSKASYGGAKAGSLKVKAKFEEFTFPGINVTSRRRAVPHKPVGVRAADWYKQIGGRKGYDKLYTETEFGQYRRGRAQYRDSVGSAKVKDKKTGKMVPARQRTSDAVLSGKLASLYATMGIPGAHIGAPATKRRTTKGGKSRSGGVKTALQQYQELYKQLKGRGLLGGGPKDYKLADLREIDALHPELKFKYNGSRANPVSALANVSALQNPSFDGLKSWFTGYAFPVYVGAGVTGGALHGAAAALGVTRRVEGLSRKVFSLNGYVPTVGDFVANNLTHSVQGILVGAVLGALSPIAARYVSPRVGGLLASAGAGAVVGGGIIDAYTFARDYLGGEEDSDSDASLVAMGDDTGALAFGDLAFERGMGDLAFAQANPIFSGASLSAPSPLGGDDLGRLYSGASFADAYYSGADFSGVEGEALLNGSQAWCNTFGNPPVRMAGRNPGGPSHLAGQEGHRWGWLIAAVGSDRARKICALPPASRLKVIQQLRKAAIQAYQRIMLESKAAAAEEGSSDPELLPAAGLVSNGASGAVGAGSPNMDYMGDPVVFMGS